MLLFLCAYPPRRHPPIGIGSELQRGLTSPPARRGTAPAALAYLILPIDFIKAKDNPLLGWLDEAISIGVLIQKMSNRITPEIEARADAQLDRWFAPNPYLSLP